MADVTTFDKNLRVERVKRDGLCFYSAEEAPFTIHGVIRDGDRFRRLPSAVADTVSEAVAFLGSNTAGGRVRFATDSDVIVAEVHLPFLGKMPHFALTGSVGLDVYADEGEGFRYAGSLIPPFDVGGRFEARVTFPSKKRREILIHFPLYSAVSMLYIGIKEEALLEAARPYADERPVVFYGSSITQGGCASRPGNSYQAIASREMGFEFVNLGFSGSALAEQPMIEYIASLDMRVFVLDYDHNAPTVEHLKATHEPFYKAVRAAHPTIPIVMMSRPLFRLNAEELERLAVVRATYEAAVAAGDRDVYMIDGRELVGEALAEVSTVDGAHPNDAGFFAMAKRLEQTLQECL